MVLQILFPSLSALSERMPMRLTFHFLISNLDDILNEAVNNNMDYTRVPCLLCEQNEIESERAGKTLHAWDFFGITFSVAICTGKLLL